MASANRRQVVFRAPIQFLNSFSDYFLLALAIALYACWCLAKRQALWNRAIGLSAFGPIWEWFLIHCFVVVAVIFDVISVLCFEWIIFLHAAGCAVLGGRLYKVIAVLVEIWCMRWRMTQIHWNRCVQNREVEKVTVVLEGSRSLLWCGTLYEILRAAFYSPRLMTLLPRPI